MIITLFLYILSENYRVEETYNNHMIIKLSVVSSCLKYSYLFILSIYQNLIKIIIINISTDSTGINVLNE